MAEHGEKSHDDTDTSSDESDAQSQSEPELMITTRERRKTAGNRYSQVVAQEQIEEDVEDDVALLFAEAEGEDEEYNSDEADDEADMSSSDDDDQGPNAAPDDMDGEQEVVKQAKVERQKKRKADMAMTTMSAITKKPKIDPTALHRAPERVKSSKRKERVSWLPVESSAPGRTSLRKQTVAHREVLLERLKENEELRLKNKAQREIKEKQKKADAPKVLTQADRLAEAEKNERRNAKSLNRWETMEKQRAEEQAARLAALKDRTLDGAVLTYHSALHVYRSTQHDTTTGAVNGEEEHVFKKRGPKPKQSIAQQSRLLALSIPSSTQISQPTTGPNTPLSTTSTITAPGPITLSVTESKLGPDDWLSGIHEYASMPPTSSLATPLDVHGGADSGGLAEQKPPTTTVLPPAAVAQENAVENAVENTAVPEIGDLVAATVQEPPNEQNSEPVAVATESITTPAIAEPIPDTLPAMTQIINTPQPPQPEEPPSESPLHLPSATVPVPPPPHLSKPLESTPLSTHSHSPDPSTISVPPVVEVTSTRNLVILQDFEDLTADAKQAFSVFYGTKKPPKPVKHVTELCSITNLPVKYRDPFTNISYANATAYKKLQALQKHTYVWSSMLGCYVGKTQTAARGVPDEFLSV